VKIAWLFPGQGSQEVGMGKALAEASPAARDVFARADAALGEPISRLCFEGPLEELTLTRNTQPAIVATSCAITAALIDRLPAIAPPVCAAGHSLGEYSALVAAGALSLADAVPLVRLRAQAMQQAVPVGAGAMAAILGLDADAVRAGCAEAAAATGEPVEAANYNDPKQTVISGAKAAVDKACELLKAAGAKRALPLAVSAPFHSSLMKPAAEALRARLETVALAAPTIPLVNNIDVAVQTDPAAIKEALYRQAFGPVRWVETVQALKARGIAQVVECGPGKVLAGLVKRVEPELAAFNIFDPASLADTKGALA
jgi:[acyl-carrier-protein] S-malonyltransferase